MDIKSWDYVDPKIAKRLLDLERTRNTLQQQHTNLTANNRLHSELKDKLIEQTKKVQTKLSSILNREKHELLDYYDKQIIVVSKTKEQEKVPRLPIRQEESTVEHSNIAEQLKTSVSTRRTKKGGAARQECSVNQFSIREKEDEQGKDEEPTTSRKKASVLGSRVLRLKRKVKRQKQILSIVARKHQKRLSLLDSPEEQQEESMEPCSVSEIQLADYLEELQQYRRREEQTDEYISLLKKKMKATTEHYEQRENDLQQQLADCAQRLSRLAQDHSRLDELESQNETLRLERDELLKLLKQFV